MSNEFANTSNAGFLKDYYDTDSSPIAEALKRRRLKLKDKMDQKEESENG